MPQLDPRFRRPDRVELGMALAVMLLIIVIALLLSFVTATSASSHSFYDYDCCSDRDCGPVADGVVEERADGVHVQGYGVIPANDRRIRRSKDDQDHLCVYRGALLCVYVKPKAF